MAIGHSPFYETGETTLPNGNHVDPGGLYIIDDEGGVVFQVFNDPGTELTGTINSSEAVVNNVANSLLAKSYKDTGCSSSSDKTATFTYGMTIEKLIESGRPTLNTAKCKFKVKNTNEEDDYYFVYDVRDDNAQLALIHEVEERVNQTTKTKAEGLVYVQHGQKVYVGFPTPTDIEIDDPDECFY